MAQHETIQAARDAGVVATAIAEIDRLCAEDGDTWRTAQAEAAGYIDALYDEFTPNIDKNLRSMGRALGAVGLALVELRYGKNEYHPKLYSGSYEQNVLATYHHAGHSRQFLRGIFEYGTAANEIHPDIYDDEAFAQFPPIAAGHDAIMGNGRGNDERQSSLLAAELLPRFGFGPRAVETTPAAIDATTWDPKKQSQSFDPAKPYLAYQRAACVGDMIGVFTPRGPYNAVCLAVEDFGKHEYGQIFTREARAQGFTLDGRSIDECVELIDRSEALTAKYGAVLLGHSRFAANLRLVDPALDDIFPGRTDHAAFLRQLGEAHQAKSLTATATLIEARDYMQAGDATARKSW